MGCRERAAVLCLKPNRAGAIRVRIAWSTLAVLGLLAGCTTTNTQQEAEIHRLREQILDQQQEIEDLRRSSATTEQEAAQLTEPAETVQRKPPVPEIRAPRRIKPTSSVQYVALVNHLPRGADEAVRNALQTEFAAKGWSVRKRSGQWSVVRTDPCLEVKGYNHSTNRQAPSGWEMADLDLQFYPDGVVIASSVRPAHVYHYGGGGSLCASLFLLDLVLIHNEWLREITVDSGVLTYEEAKEFCRSETWQAYCYHPGAWTFVFHPDSLNSSQAYSVVSLPADLHLSSDPDYTFMHLATAIGSATINGMPPRRSESGNLADMLHEGKNHISMGSKGDFVMLFTDVRASLGPPERRWAHVIEFDAKDIRDLWKQ